jgi:hypothetical protein
MGQKDCSDRNVDNIIALLHFLYTHSIKSAFYFYFLVGEFWDYKSYRYYEKLSQNLGLISIYDKLIITVFNSLSRVSVSL